MPKRNFGFSVPKDTTATLGFVLWFFMACAAAGSILAIVYRLVVPS